MQLSDEYVEKAARMYCTRMGLDPDERVHLPNDGGKMLYMIGPQWRNYTHAVRSAAAMSEVLLVVTMEACGYSGTVTAVGEPPIGPDGKPDWGAL